MDLDRLADEALLGSPYRIENGVHPYDQQRAIAGLYEYSLLIWQRRGVIWDTARTALGYVGILRRSKGLQGGEIPLSWAYRAGPEEAHSWLRRFNRNLNHVVMYDTGLENSSLTLCVCVMAIAKIAESNGDPISIEEALQGFDRIGV
jgi:hypothetical protein